MGPHRGGITVTGDRGVRGYSDDQTRGCQASSMQQTRGLQVTFLKPLHPITSTLLVHGQHFTLTPPPVLMSSQPGRGQVV